MSEGNVTPMRPLSQDEADQFRERLQHFDSFVNPGTGIGGSFDKRVPGFARPRLNDYQYWQDLYRANDMAARIVDAGPDDMTRKGWKITIEGEHDMSEDIDGAAKDLDVVQQFLQALKWERAFGGAGIFVGANDGQTADMPLNEDNIRSIDFLLPLDVLELVPNGYYVNPLEAKYGLPASYRLNRFGAISPVGQQFGGMPTAGGLAALSGGVLEKATSLNSGGLSAVAGAQNWNFLPIVHESRVIRFGGIFINRLQLRQQRYWGDSVFVRCEEVLRDFNLSWSSASILLQDFAQAVIKMKGMAALQAKIGQKAFADAAAMIEKSRSVANALLLDSEDSFERSRTPLEGLPDMLDKFSHRLAATAEMPVSRLFGESPGGLNATGEVNQDWWYDKVESDQVNKLDPRLARFYTLLMKAKKGPTNGVVPKKRGNWNIKFHPLKPLNPKDEAQRRLFTAQTDQIYVNMPGGLMAEEVVTTRFGGDEYDGDKIELVESDPKKRALKQAELGELRAPDLPEPDPVEDPANPVDPTKPKPGPTK